MNAKRIKKVKDAFQEWARYLWLIPVLALAWWITTWTGEFTVTLSVDEVNVVKWWLAADLVLGVVVYLLRKWQALLYGLFVGLAGGLVYGLWGRNTLSIFVGLAGGSVYGSRSLTASFAGLLYGSLYGSLTASFAGLLAGLVGVTITQKVKKRR